MIVIPMEPVRVRTVEGFRAVDPWNSGKTSAFSLDAYKWVPKGARRPAAFWGAKEIYGIRSELDGVDRLLPDSLGVLAVEGRLAKEKLPRLLVDITPSLRKSDFRPIWSTTVHYWVLALFGTFSAAALAMAAMQFLGANTGREPVRTDLASWLARPEVPGENVVTSEGAKIAGSVDADFTPQAPPDVVTYPSSDGHYRLAWVRAARGHRLFLLPAPLVASGSASLNGITFARNAIGVPDALYASVRARVPDLESDLVMCVFWSYQGGGQGSSIGALIWGVFAVVGAIGGGIPALIVGSQKARRRRQMEWALGRP